MAPSQTAATPSVAKKAGRTVVAISCDQSLKSEAKPMPSVVRFNQDFDFIGKGLGLKHLDGIKQSRKATFKK